MCSDKDAIITTANIKLGRYDRRTKGIERLNITIISLTIFK